jgi:hypothetical protein
MVLPAGTGVVLSCVAKSWSKQQQQEGQGTPSHPPQANQKILADANHHVTTFAGPILALSRLLKGVSKATSTDAE